MTGSRDRFDTPGLAAVAAVGLVLGGLLVGYQPVGGDPDRIYRPIKAELARALREGRLPLWSDRFGLGIPLLAESHAAALYPPNWLLYGLLDVDLAYRLAMWAHYAAMALTTYLYARTLGLTAWGGALAAVSFSLCGFQAIHSSHEWAYHVLAFLPLVLFLAERFMAEGRVVWLALLALAYGAQLTLGHFQVQFWSAGLALLTGLWRAAIDGRPWRRALGVGLGLGWGAAIAAVQLALTWELARFVGTTQRPLHELAFYSFPPAHWAQLALPRLFADLRGGPEDPYWFRQSTTGYEACLYVGTVPLILAFVGLVAGRRRGVAPWTLVVPASLALATLPRWWPEGYALLLQLPGLGYFRCPARYTALTSLGLCLLAGRGLDHDVTTRRWALGLALALAFGAAATAWGLDWAAHSDLRRSLATDVVPWRLGESAAAWATALVALLVWRRGRGRAWVPLVVTAVELGILYYLGTTVWGWPVRLPADSPALARLAREPGVVRVAGPLDDLAVRAGVAPAFPYLGFAPPPPHRMLEVANARAWSADPIVARWLRRYGVTHGVWTGPVAARGVESIYEGPDRALDRLAYRPFGAPERASWRVVRYPAPFPAARAVLRARVVPDERTLLDRLATTEDPEEAWFAAVDRPPDSNSPRARRARVLNFDGRVARVEHDGTCDLVVARTFYPGWSARRDRGPYQPTSRADGGLQAVRLVGSGSTTCVEFAYAPGRLGPLAALAATATLAALLLAAASARRPRTATPGPVGAT